MSTVITRKHMRGIAGIIREALEEPGSLDRDEVKEAVEVILKREPEVFPGRREITRGYVEGVLVVMEGLEKWLKEENVWFDVDRFEDACGIRKTL